MYRKVNGLTLLLHWGQVQGAFITYIWFPMQSWGFSELFRNWELAFLIIPTIIKNALDVKEPNEALEVLK